MASDPIPPTSTSTHSPSLPSSPIASTSSLSPPPPTSSSSLTSSSPIFYRPYKDESDIPTIMGLVDTELSEPYNFYTYRYFLGDWAHLCFMAYEDSTEKVPVGTIVCKQELHRDKLNRGYLAMLSTKPSHRGKGIATHLVRLSITAMISTGCEEVVLETEVDNLAALKFYEKFGFIREKRLYRFYLNAKDAFRLFLLLDRGVREEWRRCGGELGEEEDERGDIA